MSILPLLSLLYVHEKLLYMCSMGLEAVNCPVASRVLGIPVNCLLYRNHLPRKAMSIGFQGIKTILDQF